MSAKQAEKVVENTKDEYAIFDEDEEEVVAPPDDLTEGFIAEADGKSQLKSLKAYQDMEPIDVIGSSLDKVITKLGREAANELNSRPKHKVMIPLNDLSPMDTYAVACINSWVFQLKRGVPVLLPAEVIDLFAEGGYNPTLVR